LIILKKKKLWKNPIGISNERECCTLNLRYDSIFQPYVDSQTEILILGTMPGIASLEKQGIMHTKEIILENTVHDPECYANI
jgi:hypothetical protein